MTASTSLVPFQVDVPAADVDDLRARLRAARWPDPAPRGDAAADASRGIPLDRLRELAASWLDEFDWTAAQARLNAVPQVRPTIDGQPVHALHARSPRADALPVLLLHGYPSSPVEYLDLLGLLTDPATHGGDPTDAFHVVVPSLPGFGFSSPVRDPGWEVGRTTSAYAELMRLLGYERYAVVGSDIGAGVAGRLSALHPDRVVGTLVVSETAALGVAGEHFPVPDHLTDADRERVAVEQARWQQERGYLVLQTTRPETIGVALTDSPLAQLAWVAEKFDAWTSPASPVDRDLLLATVSLLWFTRSGAGAARFLWEAEHSDLDWLSSSDVPTGWAVFGADPVVRRFMDPDHRSAFWSEHAEGGHFPALEVPELVVSDVRAFLRPLR